MKKTLFPLVLVSALLTFFSCDKSFDAKEDGLLDSSEAKEFTATIEGDDNTKTILTVNEEGKNVVEWESGDQITIVDKNNNAGVFTATPKDDDKTQATFTYVSGGKPSSSPFKAYYPETIYDGGTLTLPATQTCNGTFALNPMYAYSTDTKLPFKNICSVIKLKTDIANVTKIELSTTDKSLSGPFTLTEGDNYPTTLTMSMTGSSDAHKKVTLNVSTSPTAVGGFYYYYIAIPAQKYGTLTINVTTESGTKTMTKKMPSDPLLRNTIYSLTFKEDLALKGVFSVSSTKKVKFSPGNLYYNTSTKEYHFEANQYDYRHHYDITADNSSCINGTKSSTTPSNTVGTFRWGKIEDAITTSTDTPSSDFFAATEMTVDGESGWKALDANGGSGEWNYLINTRTMKEMGNTRYYRTTVNGVYGMILFPDDYPSSLGTTASWEEMEAAGCVFLPAAGYRYRSSVDGAGSNGFYWSSTPDGDYGAYGLYFNSGLVNVDYDYRYYGFSVRLVQESK